MIYSPVLTEFSDSMGVAMRINKVAAAVLLGISALGLSACATGLRTQVSRFQAMPNPQGQSFVVVPMNPGDQGGLEFSQYAEQDTRVQYVPGGTLQPVVQRVQHAAPHQRTGRLLLDVVDGALEQRGELRPSESSVRRKLESWSWPEAVAWLGARLAAALDYAHRKNVLHRDIKPANVLLTAEGQPKLADFNVSFSSKLDGATPAAYFGGSLAYMSPEQLEAANPAHTRDPRELDGRSDVFSLGVMLWELLTGERPFGDEHFSGSWNTTLDGLIERRRQGVSGEMLARLPRDLPPGTRTSRPRARR